MFMYSQSAHVLVWGSAVGQALSILETLTCFNAVMNVGSLSPSCCKMEAMCHSPVVSRQSMGAVTGRNHCTRVKVKHTSCMAMVCNVTMSL